MKYHEETRTEEGFAHWLDRWVLGVERRSSYVRLVGEKKLRALRVRWSHRAAPVEYGY
jgi:hypothetical protein